MTKVVCVSQPGYFQPLHYYARVYESDVFVSLAGAQLTRKSGQHRAELYGQTLTVPIKGGNRQALEDAIPVYEDSWVDKHIDTLKQVYGKTPMYKNAGPMIWRMLVLAEHEKWSLAKIGFECLRMVMDYVDWKGTLAQEGKRPESIGNPSDWMLKIAKDHCATAYLCGQPAYEGYLKHDDFRNAGVELKVQSWKCPEYKQKKSGFVPNLSIIDAMMNCTKEELVEVLKGARE